MGGRGFFMVLPHDLASLVCVYFELEDMFQWAEQNRVFITYKRFKQYWYYKHAPFSFFLHQITEPKLSNTWAEQDTNLHI